MKKIVIAADHLGLQLKDALAAHLRAAGWTVDDLGVHSEDPVDYPDVAVDLAEKVAAGEYGRGVLVCGTGAGMAITANKVPGVRAAKCNDPHEARMCRNHNDANVLCVGSRVLDPVVMDEVVQTFLSETFEGGRHARRVQKMMDLDEVTD